MESLLKMFVHVDNFCQAFLPKLEQSLLSRGAVKRHRERSLSISEVMTILIHFHQSHYRNFKTYYCEHVQPQVQCVLMCTPSGWWVV
jgi:hypothetical protein